MVAYRVKGELKATKFVWCQLAEEVLTDDSKDEDTKGQYKKCLV